MYVPALSLRTLSLIPGTSDAKKRKLLHPCGGSLTSLFNREPPFSSDIQLKLGLVFRFFLKMLDLFRIHRGQIIQ